MGNFLPFLFIAVYQLLQKRNSKTPIFGHLYPEKWAVFSFKEMRAPQVYVQGINTPKHGQRFIRLPLQREMVFGTRPKKGVWSQAETGLCQWKHLWRHASHCAHLLYWQSTSCISSAFVGVSEITNKITSSDRLHSTIWKADKVGWGRTEGSFIFLCFILFGLYSIPQSSKDELEPSLHWVLIQFSGIKWQVNNPCSQHYGWGKLSSVVWCSVT